MSNVERGLCNPTLKKAPAWCEAIGANPKIVRAKLVTKYRKQINDAFNDVKPKGEVL